MDWTEDAQLHKRYIEWKEEVELELGSSLSYRSNSVKSNYVLRWAGKPARDYLKSLPDSEFKYEGASAEAILEALQEKTKSKSNEIAAFTKLHCLKQGDMLLLSTPTTNRVFSLAYLRVFPGPVWCSTIITVMCSLILVPVEVWKLFRAVLEFMDWNCSLCTLD